MAELYPEIEPNATYSLDVGDGHVLYVEESGNPDGKPAVVVHGGPGGGSAPKQRRFFDPDAYRIVLLDQRGCGRSTPTASVEHNTTWHLVADLERVRAHLGIDRWLVFGGSWGSTLSLAYSQMNPERVTELVLRGIFLLRRSELDFFYQHGTSDLFPDAWEQYLAPIPDEERGDLVAAYHRPRDVAVDLVGNLVKERLDSLVPVAIEAANRRVDPPITRHEAERWYRSDSRMWEVLLRLRRADRSWQRRVRRRTYPFLLPERIER